MQIFNANWTKVMSKYRGLYMLGGMKIYLQQIDYKY